MSDLSTIRWGILAPGSIARSFAKGIEQLPDHIITAVGSRNQERAESFAVEYGVSRAYGSYEQLVRDPGVDVIYVASPHPAHAPHSLLALRAGKPVLCEKPFTLSEATLIPVVAEARSRNLFLMEGMWTRFWPLMGRVRELVADGAIGELRMVQADFGFRTDFKSESRLFDPELGGGALLDVGIYPISFASMLLGEPDEVVGLADLGQTGVDEQSAFILKYPKGQLAVLATAVRTHTIHRADIIGTEGRISITPPFWRPVSAELVRGDQTEEISYDHVGTGFQYEAAEVGRCLRAGLTESPIMTLDESLSIMRTMDKLRDSWGLKYPGEA